MVDTPKPPTGFVSLKSITKGTPDPATALDEIRRIYFKTKRETIEHDFAHAIELIKALPDEASRSKAHVFMEGLAEMRRDWVKPVKARPKQPAGEVSGERRSTAKTRRTRGRLGDQ